MSFRSLRSWLKTLETKGYLKKVKREVDPVYELAAVAKKADGQWAVKFEKVKGYSVPVVAGILHNRQLIAEAMKINVAELVTKFAEAQANPLPCCLIDREKAPVKEVIVRDNIDLGSMFPIPTHHEKDAGPYITAALLIAKDPCTGVRNVSIHRLQLLGPNRLGILILPRHLWHIFRQVEEKDQPLEIALVIGVDPLTLLASQAITPFGVDELEIASALHGEPLQLVKCETVDIEVPAHAEIVLEGRLLPGVREIEGPFGEYPKYYGPASKKPVIVIDAVTCRRRPIYQTIVAATREHLLLGAIPREATLFQMVRQAVPTVRAVHLTPGGTCRYHAVIAIDKRHEGEAKNAIFAAFASSAEVKHVVVVDKDVDIFNPEDVEWAIATRCQASKDVIIISQAHGNRLDPSSDDGLSDKMGIDATVPLSAPAERFERIRIPGFEKIRLEEYLGD
ncbi:UbiD family decarboxylase [Calderihabitans maritimus]|uniref:Phenolic acid decarboxylase n=1 Tax=Calderihabitans maritimus TaxID=1246530 RepID=A0A1Z5HNY6_9FIRM|nr:UbiD family decarboxylase [Calderihabitans maritimus]GAW91031.1 UbiD family decarboxylase [Calderihabitans maritimus]